MKKFTNTTMYEFTHNGKEYQRNVKEIDISSNDVETIKNNLSKVSKTGIYFLVLKDDFMLSYSNFYSETTGIFFKEGCPYTVEFTPHLNIKENEKNSYMLEKDFVAYVGKAENFSTRISEHLFGDKINGTASLKLGLKSRESIKEHLKLLIVEGSKDECRDMENNARDKYGSYFGK